MERVITLLANFFSSRFWFKEVHLITLTKSEILFNIEKGINVHTPEFYFREYNRLRATTKTCIYIRNKIKTINPDIILSFGDRFNSFVIFSSLGLRKKVFVSNRMNPFLSNGLFLDLLNTVFYKFCEGLIAQTIVAKNAFLQKGLNSNIVAIGNPVNKVTHEPVQVRKKTILNVGRFAGEKNQEFIVEYFLQSEKPDWTLLFIGEGHRKEFVEKIIILNGSPDNIVLKSNVNDINNYYSSASIFAFSSTSEGFPNALAEAMAAGCACISFDCIAGPSDIIDNDLNGFLIPLGDHEGYIQKLILLMEDESLRDRFGKAAKEKMKQFAIEDIAEKYYDFITQ